VVAAVAIWVAWQWVSERERERERERKRERERRERERERERKREREREREREERERERARERERGRERERDSNLFAHEGGEVAEFINVMLENNVVALRAPVGENFVAIVICPHWFFAAVIAHSGSIRGL
jgi:Flp pilus assembly protein TadB